MDSLGSVIEAIDLLPQRQSFERPQAFPVLLFIHPWWEKRLRYALLLKIVFSLQLLAKLVLLQKRAGVKPGACSYRGLVEFGFLGLRSPQLLHADHVVGESLGILLFDQCKTPKFALDAIEIAMMIAKLGDKTLAADAIAGLNALDHLDRERKPGNPGKSGLLIGEIKCRGGRVIDKDFGTEVIDYLDQQVWLLPAHQIDIPHWLLAIAGQGRGPGEARGTLAEQIDHLD